MEIHRSLIDRSRLYPDFLINNARDSDPHWETASWQEREESLRHDYVCILLPNGERYSTEPGTSDSDPSVKSSSSSEIAHSTEKAANLQLRGQMRAQGILDEPGDSQASDSEMGEEHSGDEGLMYLSFGDDSEEEGATAGPSEAQTGLEELVVGTSYNDGFRYVVLEGVTRGKRTQASYTTAWGIQTDKAWDILDKKTKKLIEVKVSKRNPMALWNELTENTNTPIPSIGLVVVCIASQHVEVEYYNCDRMKGEELVCDFLYRRNAFIMEHRGDLPLERMDAMLLPNQRFADSAEDWYRPVDQMSREAPQPNIVNRPIKLVPFRPEDLLPKLDDPSTRVAPSAKWQGKILPMSWVECSRTLHDRDSQMVLEFLETMTFESHRAVNWQAARANSLKEQAQTLVQGFIETLKRGETHVKVRSTKRGYKVVGGPESTPNFNESLACLGVGQKPQKKTTALLSDMKQPPPRTGSERVRSYDDWPHQLVKTESEVIELVASGAIDFTEGQVVHPWDALAQNACRELYNLMTRIRAGHTCYRVMNFYSRLGGPYALDVVLGNAAHSSIAVFPIYHTAHKKRDLRKKPIRLLSGVVFRGPHHLREATDKVNLLIIERVGPNCRVDRVLEKGILLDSKWFVRCNAIRKADPTYLSFLHNAFFVPMNYAGELMSAHANFAKLQADPAEWSTIFGDVLTVPRQYHAERLTEIIMMGILGGSQEEGHFAILRMVYMLLLEYKNSEPVFVLDLDALAQAMNECLIDSAWAMYWHAALRDVVKCQIDLDKK